jgi:hypothetical protein
MLSFKIEKCDYNNKKAGCHPEAKVEDYISDIQLDAWIIHSRINFTDRANTPPTFRTSDLYYSTILNTSPKSLVDRNYIYLRKNSIYTEDSLFFNFEYSHYSTYYDLGK